MNVLLGGFAAVLGLLAAAIGALVILLVMDLSAERREWRRLAALQPSSPERFSPDMVAGLPEPAQRYFRYTIEPGTPLLTVAEITMKGQFSLGTKEAPAYRPMTARQILAAPEGFVFAMRLRGGMPVSGSDTGRWTRFKLLGLVPVARAGGDRDHARSAFGRYVAEAAFWSPAALLPGPGISWEGVDESTARVTIRHGNLSQSVDVTVAAYGRPTEVSFLRWSDAGPEGQYGLKPFGGTLGDFRKVGGYRLPFRVEAGHGFGTDAFFPFFRAEVTGIAFPEAARPKRR